MKLDKKKKKRMKKVTAADNLKLEVPQCSKVALPKGQVVYHHPITYGKVPPRKKKNKIDYALLKKEFNHRCLL